MANPNNEQPTRVPAVLPIYITGIVAIATIGAIALLCGHDNTLVTGITSGIVGLTAGFGAYYYGKEKTTNEIRTYLTAEQQKQINNRP